MCDGRPGNIFVYLRLYHFALLIILGLIPPIEPFRTSNRFTTATVFGIIAFEVLKIFEEIFLRTATSISRGVLFELIERIAMVVLVG